MAFNHDEHVFSIRALCLDLFLTSSSLVFRLIYIMEELKIAPASTVSICKTLVTSWHHLQGSPHHDLRKQVKNFIYSTRRYSNSVNLKSLIFFYFFY